MFKVFFPPFCSFFLLAYWSSDRKWAMQLAAIASLIDAQYLGSKLGLEVGVKLTNHSLLLTTPKDRHINQHFATLGKPNNILFEDQMDSVTERAGGQAPEECS